MKVDLDVDQALRGQQVLLAGCWSVLAALYDDLGLPGPILASASLYEFHVDASCPLEDVMVASAEFFLEAEGDADAAIIRIRVREMRVVPGLAQGAGKNGFVS